MEDGFAVDWVGDPRGFVGSGIVVRANALGAAGRGGSRVEAKG